MVFQATKFQFQSQDIYLSTASVSCDHFPDSTKSFLYLFFFFFLNRIASQIAPTDWIRLCSKEEAYRLLVWCVPPHANTPFWMMCSTRYLSRMAREAVISGRSVLIYYAEGPKTTRPRAAVIDGAQGQALCGGVAGEFIVRFGVDIEMV